MNPNFKALTPSRKELSQTLIKFYQKPIAQVSIELLMSVSLVLFFAIFAIRPTLLTMSDLIKEINDKKELSNKLSQKIAALNTAQTEYLSLESQLSLLDEALPSTPKVINSLKIVERLAEENSLNINTINMTEVPEEVTALDSTKPIERLMIPVSVILSGDFPHIKKFIDDLQQVRRTFVIDTIMFNLSDENGAPSLMPATSSRLKATVTLGLPYFGTKTAPKTNAKTTSSELPTTLK